MVDSADSFELLRRHRAGDRDALDTLLRRSLPKIRRIVRVRMGHLLRSLTTAEDLVQDTIVRVVKDMDHFEPRSDARWIDWVAKAAQHEIQNQVRARMARKRTAEVAGESAVQDVAVSATGASSLVVRAELKEILDQHVAELPEAQREVVLLRHFAHGDWEMIAEQMGRSVAACQELERRARVALAHRMRRARG